MLSIFPTLLSYNLLVPLLFRIVVGLLFISFSYETVSKNRDEKATILENYRLKPGKFWLWALSAFEIAGGVLLLIGLFTQAASLALSVGLILGLMAKKKSPAGIPLSQPFLFLLLLVTASLLFLGPGIYAFDLPL